jgi:hypothetical protein
VPKCVSAFHAPDGTAITCGRDAGHTVGRHSALWGSPRAVLIAWDSPQCGSYDPKTFLNCTLPPKHEGLHSAVGRTWVTVRSLD